MDEFDLRFNLLDIEEIKKFLLNQKKPCFESSLLKAAFKIENISEFDSLTLYQNHFLLFNVLYKLQEEFYKSNKYLHVHFMRIFLSDYPEKNQCHFYDEYNGVFCKNNNTDDSSYCSFHLKKIGQSNIDNLSIKYFYFDKSNFYKLNNKQADELINGAWELLTSYDEYKKSFEILDLPESADLETIKKRYKYLAKKYHPDCLNSLTTEININKKFTEINNAYRYLIKMLEINNVF